VLVRIGQGSFTGETETRSSIGFVTVYTFASTLPPTLLYVRPLSCGIDRRIGTVLWIHYSQN